MVCESAERLFDLKTRLRPVESIDGVSVAGTDCPCLWGGGKF